MLQAVGQNWWMFLVQGVAAILFGLGALAWPGLTLTVLIALFGAYALADGIVALVAMFQTSAQSTPWWVWLLRGITGIGAALVTFAWPGMTAMFLVFVIAARALLSGIFEIVAAIHLRKELDNEWLLALSGLLSVVLGVFLVVAPGAGALAVLWWIGAFAIVFGILEIVLGFRLKGVNARLAHRRA